MLRSLGKRPWSFTLSLTALLCMTALARETLSLVTDL